MFRSLSVVSEAKSRFRFRRRKILAHHRCGVMNCTAPMARFERESWIARTDDGNGRRDLRAWLGVGGAVISEVADARLSIDDLCALGLTRDNFGAVTVLTLARNFCAPSSRGSLGIL